jgi:hypothetical protein
MIGEHQESPSHMVEGVLRMPILSGVKGSGKTWRFEPFDQPFCHQRLILKNQFLWRRLGQRILFC